MGASNSQEHVSVIEILADIIIVMILAVIAVPVYLHERRASLRRARVAPTTERRLATVADQAAA